MLLFGCFGICFVYDGNWCYREDVFVGDLFLVGFLAVGWSVGVDGWCWFFCLFVDYVCELDGC